MYTLQGGCSHNGSQYMHVTSLGPLELSSWDVLAIQGYYWTGDLCLENKDTSQESP